MGKRTLEEENAYLKAKLKKCNERYRYNKKKISELKRETKRLKEEHIADQKQISKCKDELKELADSEFREKDLGPIPGRKYTERFMRTVVKLYTRVSCGARGVAEIMKVIGEEYGINEKISHTEVLNMVKTAGFALYKEARNDIKQSKMKYALVIDQSITIGSQKLLLILAIPSEHLGRPLKHSDAIVCGMYVAETWNSETVAEKLSEVIQDITYEPTYVVSDNGCDLVKAVRDLGITHHKDISHTFGILLKKNIPPFLNSKN